VTLGYFYVKKEVRKLKGKGKDSKNNPDTRKKMTGKMVDSTTCENCKHQCEKGKLYLINFYRKHEGKGVYCDK
jgi:ribosomal protein L44E